MQYLMKSTMSDLFPIFIDIRTDLFALAYSNFTRVPEIPGIFPPEV